MSATSVALLCDNADLDLCRASAPGGRRALPRDDTRGRWWTFGRLRTGSGARARYGRHGLGYEGELAAFQRDRRRPGVSLALAADGAHHRLLLLKLASHRKGSGS